MKAPKGKPEVDVTLLGSSGRRGDDDDEPSESDDDADKGYDFDSAADDAFEAYMEKDKEGWKAALRNAIEAVLDEHEG